MTTSFFFCCKYLLLVSLDHFFYQLAALHLVIPLFPAIRSFDLYSSVFWLVDRDFSVMLCVDIYRIVWFHCSVYSRAAVHVYRVCVILMYVILWLLASEYNRYHINIPSAPPRRPLWFVVVRSLFRLSLVLCLSSFLVLTL